MFVAVVAVTDCILFRIGEPRVRSGATDKAGKPGNIETDTSVLIDDNAISLQY